jgi:hypothetical protein
LASRVRIVGFRPATTADLRACLLFSESRIVNGEGLAEKRLIAEFAEGGQRTRRRA